MSNGTANVALPGTIFIHIPRTGGVSIANLLGGRPFKHWSTEMIRHAIGEEEWRKAFVFTCVRNPYDRLVSIWHFAKQTMEYPYTFHEYLKRNDIGTPMEHINQMAWLVTQGKIDVDMILRFEDLDRTFTNLPHLNASERPPWQEFIDEEAEKAIYGMYRWDFDNLGYERFEI